MLNLFRPLYVFFALVPFVLSFLRDYQRYFLFGGPRELSLAEHEERARRLTRRIAQLGPTFIKGMQVLASREDLLPRVYTREFRTLQDRVPPFPVARALDIIREELGRPASEVFESFDPAPLAAASLGQVHRATFEGRPVVVKIRRPGVEDIVASDLAVLMFLSQLANALVDSYLLRALHTMLREFRRMITEEMDFRNEASSADRLRANLAKFTNIIIPEYVVSHTTRRVAVLAYHEGVRIDDVEALRARGISHEQVVALLIECFVHQVVFDGFLHADPHPGNLLLDPQGRLVLLDFGMTIDIDKPTRDELLAMVSAMLRNDVDRIVEGFYRLRMVEPQINPSTLRDAARMLMNIQLTSDISPRRMQEICEDVYRTFYKFPLRLPQPFVYVLRASALIEGIGITFDPNFNGVLVARPILSRMLAEKMKGDLGNTIGSWFDWAVNHAKGALETFGDARAFFHRARRDELQMRLHPADIHELERTYRAMVQRSLIGVAAALLGFWGGILYMRTGSLFWLITLGGLALAALLLCVLLPLRRPVVGAREE